MDTFFEWMDFKMKLTKLILNIKDNGKNKISCFNEIQKDISEKLITENIILGSKKFREK